MRAASLVPAVVLALLSAPAYPDPQNVGSSANAKYNEADWAAWDAQARIAEGDYDGAVQAEQRAKEVREQADQVAVRTQNPPPPSETNTAPEPTRR